MAIGRPSKYDPDKHPEKATKLALLGLTDEEMAVALDIHVSTFYQWQIDFPDFSEAIKDGKVRADANVAQSLYKKAMSGDTTSAIFWLKNRRKQAWRDGQAHTLENPDGTGIFEGVTFVGIDTKVGTAKQDT